MALAAVMVVVVVLAAAVLLLVVCGGVFPWVPLRDSTRAVRAPVPPAQASSTRSMRSRARGARAMCS